MLLSFKKWLMHLWTEGLTAAVYKWLTHLRTHRLTAGVYKWLTYLWTEVLTVAVYIETKMLCHPLLFPFTNCKAHYIYTDLKCHFILTKKICSFFVLLCAFVLVFIWLMLQIWQDWREFERQTVWSEMIIPIWIRLATGGNSHFHTLSQCLKSTGFQEFFTFSGRCENMGKRVILPVKLIPNTQVYATVCVCSCEVSVLCYLWLSCCHKYGDLSQGLWKGILCI